MLRKIDRILLRVPQLTAAAKYYREVMGLHLINEGKRIITLRLPDDSTELILHTDPNLPAEAIYYLVDDVREMYKRRVEMNLTFISPPAAVSRGHTATIKDPFGLILQIIDRTHEGSAKSEDVNPNATLFAGMEPRVAPKRLLLAKLYEQVGRTADDLPYTPHFEKMYEPYANAHGAGNKPSHAETWRHLLNLRKAGKLPKLGDAKSRPPDVDQETRDRLKNLLADDIGKRDRLPYTDRFDELVDAFNKTLARPLSPHLVWRLVATIAK